MSNVKKQKTKKRVSRAAPKTISKKPASKNAIRSGLSGYLVIWRHTMDDIPLGFFKNAKEANRFAEKVSWDDGFATAKRLGIECSTPVCFAVCEFSKGQPTLWIHTRRDDDR